MLLNLKPEKAGFPAGYYFIGEEVKDNMNDFQFNPSGIFSPLNSARRLSEARFCSSPDALSEYQA